MRSNHSSWGRVDPIMTDLCDVDGISALGNEREMPMMSRAQRSEPMWSCNVELDQVEHQTGRDAPPDVHRFSEQRKASSYRLLDWLSAIGLLLASLAIAITVNHVVF
jgi:hypothetical protein